jgi:hypothetical protein
VPNVLKSVVAFVGLVPGAPTTLPHGLLDAFGVGIVPDLVTADTAPITVMAVDATNVTVRNDGAIALTTNVLCEHWHSIPRALTPGLTALTPQPFVPAGIGAAATVQPARTIRVAQTGGDATSVAAGIALAAALIPVPSTADPATVLVYPGVYNEPPFTMLAGTSLVGIGSDKSAHIIATVPTSPLMTLAPDSARARLGSGRVDTLWRQWRRRCRRAVERSGPRRSTARTSE